MSRDLLQTAALNLKKAVPLMLKHQIPTTPINYALWYTYVGEQNPALNAQLDTVIAHYNTCPPVSSELLFRQYVADPVELDVRDMRLNLEAMATELSQSIRDTNLDAADFQSCINNNFAKLNGVEEGTLSVEQVLDLVRNLVKEADNIRSSTEFFTTQLQKAQTEIDALKQKLEKTEKDVLYDALTGCLNRRAFDADIAGMLAQAPEGTCLILVDIDHFKAFNDNYGHQLGDQVLKVVAKRLQEACRDGCKLYRFGGEEFAIFIADTTKESAFDLAEQIRIKISQQPIYIYGKLPIFIQVSIGISLYSPSSHRAIENLFKEADDALYQAKRQGRNRVFISL